LSKHVGNWNEKPAEGLLRGRVTTQRSEVELLRESSRKTSVKTMERKMNIQCRKKIEGNRYEEGQLYETKGIKEVRSCLRLT